MAAIRRRRTRASWAPSCELPGISTSAESDPHRNAVVEMQRIRRRRADLDCAILALATGLCKVPAPGRTYRAYVT